MGDLRLFQEEEGKMKPEMALEMATREDEVRLGRQKSGVCGCGLCGFWVLGGGTRRGMCV